MSKLDEPIQQYCPDGVEYVKIKDCFTRLRGTPITAGKMKKIACEDGEIKIFAGGKTIIDAHESDIPNANITRVPAVLVQSRGVIDFVFYDKPFTFKNEMWAYTAADIVTVKYLYYVLKNNVQHFRDAASGMGSLPQISTPVTEEFEVPLPALPVQREIVRILDGFTLYSAELSAELSARREQFEEYRDILLSDGKKTVLGDVACYSNERISASQITGKTYVGVENLLQNKQGKVDATAIPNTGKVIRFSKGDILIGNIRPYLKKIWFADLEGGTNGDVLAINVRDTHSVLPKYLFYVLSSNNFFNYDMSFSKGAKMPRGDKDAVMKYEFLLPSIEKQRNIVSILDKFNILINGVEDGLPAEIEARQKQYEYYRDKLLTFKRKEA